MRISFPLAVSFLLALPAIAPAAPVSPGPVALDLSTPFGLRPGWRFVATPGSMIADPTGDPDDTVPGAIRLCISDDSGRTCRVPFGAMLVGGKPDLFSQPHFLNDARIVYPRPTLPLLFVQAASLHSGNNDQRVGTAVFRYDRAADAFVQVYRKLTGRNNNQEVRYIGSGRLRGAIISAEPTSDAPFGFWITVNRLADGGAYRPTLRYRSATRYGDGNPLAVIDSEMPNIQRRLKLWQPGQALPLPAGPCPRPHMVAGALWCSGARVGA